jgi:phage baseplate assembly protein W
MAFDVKKINPLDRQPKKAIGVNLPFSGDVVFNPNYFTKDAVRNNLINFFLTGKGERYMNPSFGSGLPSELFEQITEDKLNVLGIKIKDELRLYFPKVVTQDLSLIADPDKNSIEFYLKYSILDSNIEDEVIINIQQ